MPLRFVKTKEHVHMYSGGAVDHGDMFAFTFDGDLILSLQDGQDGGRYVGSMHMGVEDFLALADTVREEYNNAD